MLRLGYLNICIGLQVDGPYLQIDIRIIDLGYVYIAVRSQKAVDLTALHVGSYSLLVLQSSVDYYSQAYRSAKLIL